MVQLATRTGYCPIQSRSQSSFYHLPPYLGNIFGGLLIGTGMALTGACPGTVVVQGSLGILSSIYVGLGGLLGGVFFVKLAPLLHYTSSNITIPTKGADTASNKPVRQPADTIATRLGVGITTALLAYEALCILIIGLAAAFAPNDLTYVNPILGGLAIGAAQALSILLSRKTIGVSTAYEQLGQDFWSIILPSAHAKSPSHSAVWFVLGIIAGAKALAMQVPWTMPSGEIQEIGSLTSIAGGALMIFGARLAGGCTSGHGISGMATLSLSSFVTVAAIFAGGIGWKMLIG